MPDTPGLHQPGTPIVGVQPPPAAREVLGEPPPNERREAAASSRGEGCSSKYDYFCSYNKEKPYGGSKRGINPNPGEVAAPGAPARRQGHPGAKPPLSPPSGDTPLCQAIVPTLLPVAPTRPPCRVPPARPVTDGGDRAAWPEHGARNGAGGRGGRLQAVALPVPGAEPGKEEMERRRMWGEEEEEAGARRRRERKRRMQGKEEEGEGEEDAGARRRRKRGRKRRMLGEEGVGEGEEEEDAGGGGGGRGGRGEGEGGGGGAGELGGSETKRGAGEGGCGRRRRRAGRKDGEEDEEEEEGAAREAAVGTPCPGSPFPGGPGLTDPITHHPGQPQRRGGFSSSSSSRLGVPARGLPVGCPPGIGSSTSRSIPAGSGATRESGARQRTHRDPCQLPRTGAIPASPKQPCAHPALPSAHPARPPHVLGWVPRGSGADRGEQWFPGRGTRASPLLSGIR